MSITSKLIAFLKKTKLNKLIHAFLTLIEFLLSPVVFLTCIAARFKRKPIDVGLGPEPLINNVYHRKALEMFGCRAETFVVDVYYITRQFDVILQEKLQRFCDSIPLGEMMMKVLSRYRGIYAFIFSIFRYRAVYIYFNGGPLGVFGSIFHRFEPYLYRLAGVRTVVMPYGGDVQDLLRCPNLMFRHVMTVQYPSHRYSRKMIDDRIDLWTCSGDHIISGCDWVDYMYYWDTLMLAHFSIDTEKWQPAPQSSGAGEPLRILHAPNHREIKGTPCFIRAVEELQNEGVALELILVEKMPNEKVKEEMQRADLIADQLVIGWYAMFALEGMAMGKPVLCYLRKDLEDLYIHAGLVEADEIPLVNCNVDTVKEKIRELAHDRKQLASIGRQSRKYVEKHHSLEAIGLVFDRINHQIGLKKSKVKKLKKEMVNA